MKLKRNAKCRCSSGKKYKKCCLPMEEETERREASFWKGQIRRIIIDRLMDQKMATMPPPEAVLTQGSSGGYVEATVTSRTPVDASEKQS